MDDVCNDFIESHQKLLPFVSKGASTFIKITVQGAAKKLNNLFGKEPNTPDISEYENSDVDQEYDSEDGSEDADIDPVVSLAMSKCAISQKWPCTLCKPVIFLAKLGRHLEKKHPENPEVEDVLKTDNKKLRPRLFKRIQARMNYQYHVENGLDLASQINVNQIYTKKDGSELKLDRTVCPQCKKNMSKRHLMSHIKNFCNETQIDSITSTNDESEPSLTSQQEKQQEKQQQPPRQQQAKGKLAALGLKHDEKVRTLLANLKGDSIGAVVEKDEILLEYASYQAQKYVKSRTEQTGRQNLRLLVNFLLHCRLNSDNIFSASDLLDPGKYKQITSCLESFAGEDGDGKILHPSRGKRAGELLADLAKSGRDFAILTKQPNLRDTIMQWEELHERRHALVSKNAREVLKLRTLNTKTPFPLFEDIAKLNKHLDDKMTAWKFQKTQAAYLEICKAVLAKIILFNRKRQGEAAKILVSDFQRSLEANKQKGDPHVIQSMDRVAQFLQKSMFLLEFVAKGGGRGAVLLTDTMLARIKDIVKLRKHIVTGGSQFLFARPGSCGTHLVGHTALTEEARAAGVTDPTLFKSTHLRKHMATMAQSCHMGEGDKSLLVAYMNHTALVHSTYYETKLTDVAKGTVAQILYRINNGEFDNRTITQKDIASDPVHMAG